MGIPRKLLPLLGVLLWSCAGQLWAQEQDPDEVYRQDYEQYMKIRETKEPLKRADELLAFIQARPQSKLQTNAQTDYIYILNDLRNVENWNTLATLAQRFIKLRPRVGETYYFLGGAFYGQKKFDEAMDALARCYLLQNPNSARAKSSLETIWKGRHAGKLDGLDAFIAKIRAELT